MLYVPLAAIGLFSSKTIDGERQGRSASVNSEAGSLTEVFASAKDGETWNIPLSLHSAVHKRQNKSNIKNLK